ARRSDDLFARGAPWPRWPLSGIRHNRRWAAPLRCLGTEGTGPRQTIDSTADDECREALVSGQTENTKMKRPRKVPDFKNDREAAEIWATHDSARYAGAVEEGDVAVDSVRARRVRA